MKNRYFIRSRISEKKFREIIKLFSGDLTASQIALFSGVSRMCVNRILKQVRLKIVEFCEEGNIFNKGEVEIDESYFGARRVRGKRGRGSRGKTIVFGLKHRGGKVYTQVVKNCSVKEILPIIERKVDKSTLLHTDGFRTYDGLVDMGYKKHYRIHHGKSEFAKRRGRVRNHINGIENFWGLAKVRLSKFRGLSKDTFYLHLKECEFRFNYRRENMYKLLLKIIKNNPLKVS